MRKKYLSALLFGALLFASAGTFTSCKDYDDDIKNLQEQVDAQKSLSEKLAAAETAIAALQTADTDLQSKIDAATDAAEKAALEAQKNAIAESAKQLEAVKADLTAAIEGHKEATNEAIEEINSKIAEIQGSIQALEKLNGEIESLKNADVALNDAIKELEGKVAENSRLIGELQTALSVQEQALNDFKDATGTDIGTINDDIKKLQDKIKEIIGSDDLTSITEQLNNLKTDFETLSENVDEISESLNTVKYAFNTGVTSVSLYYSTEPQGLSTQDIELFSAKSLVDVTFGEGFEGAVDFIKGTRTKQKGQVVVRVSPVTAELTEESIKFINSKGEEPLKELIKVTGVKPYDGLLTRATSASGLWTVDLEVNGDVSNEFETEFLKATTVEGVTKPDDECDEGDNSTTGRKKILFAMKVVDKDNSRGVVSEYGLTFGETKTEAKAEIGFNVFVGTNKFCITNLHNRAFESEESGDATPDELNWVNGAKPEVILTGALKNVKEVTQGDNAQADNRQNVALNSAGNMVSNPVVESKENSFTVDMTDSGVSYYYITLDKERAVSSDDSEILTWENIYEDKIEGINKVYSVKENPIATIGFNNIDINDVLGFRVHAINADGTLADPDGRAFYVRVGEVANTAVAATDIYADASTTITVQSEWAEFNNLSQFASNNKQIGSVNIDYAKVYDKDGSEIANPFSIKFVLTDGTEQDETYFNNMKVSELAKIQKVYVTKNGAGWTDMIDDQSYNNVISFKDSKGVEIAKLEIAVTKRLPDALPADFGWKDKQLAEDGTFNCYLLPWNDNYQPLPDRNWAPESATNAYMHLDQIFNYDATKSDKAMYTFTFRTNDPNNDVKIEGINPGSSSQFNLVEADGQFGMIDCETSYSVSINYNYGKISSKDKDADWIVTDNSKKLVYHNMFGADHYELAWDMKNPDTEKVALPALKVGVETSVNFAEYMKVDNTYDNVYDYIYIDKNNNKSLKELLDEKKYLSIEKVKFVNKGTEVESEYFEASHSGSVINLNAKDVQSQPTGNVESQIVLKLKDVFGFEREVRLDITVHPNR